MIPLREKHSGSEFRFGFRHVIETSIIFAAFAGMWDASAFFTRLADLGFFLDNILRLASGGIIITFVAYVPYLAFIFILVSFMRLDARTKLVTLFMAGLLPIGAILSRNFAMMVSEIPVTLHYKNVFYALKYFWIYVPISYAIGWWLANLRTCAGSHKFFAWLSGIYFAGTMYLIITPWILQKLIFQRANVYSEVSTTSENIYLSFGIFFIAIIILPVAIWFFSKLARPMKGALLAMFWIFALLIPFIPPIFRESSAISAPPSGAELSGKPSNVILVSLDTTRYDEIGCFGSDVTLTSNIDRIAEKSILFDNAIAPMPLTGPSHLSMFTGLQPDSRYGHGVKTNGIPLDENIPTLATIADIAGYGTGAVISGFPLTGRACGMDRGFHYYNDIFEQQESSRFIPEQVWNVTAAKIMRKILRIRPWTHEPLHKSASEVTDEALSWLDENSGDPFFMFVHYFDAHYPYVPPGDFKTMYYPDYGGPYRDRVLEYGPVLDAIPTFTPEDFDWQRALYRGEISYIDSEFGRLVDWLDEKQMWDDTMVIVVADHGESFEHDYFFSHNNRVFDQLIRVPMMIHDPSKSRFNGTRVNVLVNVSDLFYTILDFLELESPDSVENMHDGIIGAKPGWDHNLMNLPMNEPESLQNSGWQFVPNQSYTLTSTEADSVGRFFSFRFRDFQIIYGPDSAPVVPELQYFDISSDPQEMNDLSGSFNWEDIPLDDALKEWAETQMSGGEEDINPQFREELDALGYI